MASQKQRLERLEGAEGNGSDREQREFDKRAFDMSTEELCAERDALWAELGDPTLWEDFDALPASERASLVFGYGEYLKQKSVN